MDRVRCMNAVDSQRLGGNSVLESLPIFTVERFELLGAT
jgi:hypothetical protein